jgi:hypothetical protein
MASLAIPAPYRAMWVMLSHQNRDLHIQLAQWSGSLAKQKKMGKV